MSDIIINPFLFSSSSYDADAQNYIDRVEIADGAALETAVKDAMNQLFLDLKSNSLWSTISYALPGCGPRTLAGGCIPLQNTTAASVSGSIGWNRELGFSVTASSGVNFVGYPTSVAEDLVGSQNNLAITVWVETLATSDACYIGTSQISHTRSHAPSAAVTRNRNSNADAATNNTDVIGFRGSSRSGSGNYTRRLNGANNTVTRPSQTPNTSAPRLFRTSAGTLQAPINTGVSWSHVGTSLTLATLETVVTTYRNAIAAAI